MMLVAGLTLMLGASASACTFFSFAGEDLVLFGNNEGHADQQTRLWGVPRTEKSYGCVFLGFNSLFAQGGVNEVGLAFDAAAIAATPLNDHPELPLPDPINFCEIALRECATIDDVVELIGRYNLSTLQVRSFCSPTEPERRSSWLLG
jgi:penicillin V acylase-like amidase (Ntn superfamily)